VVLKYLIIDKEIQLNQITRKCLNIQFNLTISLYNIMCRKWFLNTFMAYLIINEIYAKSSFLEVNIQCNELCIIIYNMIYCWLSFVQICFDILLTFALFIKRHWIINTFLIVKHEKQNKNQLMLKPQLLSLKIMICKKKSWNV